MSDMTIQEMFDKAYLGLAGQGWEQSSDDEDICLYRGPNGLKCAVGHIFESEYFKEQGENTPLYALVGRGPEMLQKVTFLRRLQVAHDNSNVNNMESRIEAVGLEYNLSLPNLEVRQ